MPSKVCAGSTRHPRPGACNLEGQAEEHGGRLGAAGSSTVQWLCRRAAQAQRRWPTTTASRGDEGSRVPGFQGSKVVGCVGLVRTRRTSAVEKGLAVGPAHCSLRQPPHGALAATASCLRARVLERHLARSTRISRDSQRPPAAAAPPCGGERPLTACNSRRRQLSRGHTRLRCTRR